MKDQYALYIIYVYWGNCICMRVKEISTSYRQMLEKIESAKKMDNPEKLATYTGYTRRRQLTIDKQTQDMSKLTHVKIHRVHTTNTNNYLQLTQVA